jgi:hypothetical protein
VSVCDGLKKYTVVDLHNRMQNTRIEDTTTNNTTAAAATTTVTRSTTDYNIELFKGRLISLRAGLSILSST